MLKSHCDGFHGEEKVDWPSSRVLKMVGLSWEMAFCKLLDSLKQEAHALTWGPINDGIFFTSWIQRTKNWGVNIRYFYSGSTNSRPDAVGALDAQDVLPLGRRGRQGSPPELETFSGSFWALPARKRQKKGGGGGEKVGLWLIGNMIYPIKGKQNHWGFGQIWEESEG